MQSLYGILGKDAMKNYLYGSFCLLLFLFSLLGACSKGIRIEKEESSSFSEKSASPGHALSSAEENEESSGEQKPPGSSSSEEVLFIHVCGSVQQPGVYELASGARAIDAVKRAGGFREDAAESALNLARELKDGEKLYIPNEEEALLMRESEVFCPEETGSEDSSKEEERVNLNTASKEELMRLPGIGEAKADAIISYRESGGGFENIEEIMQISGIKSAAFEKIKDRIEVR